MALFSHVVFLFAYFAVISYNVEHVEAACDDVKQDVDLESSIPYFPNLYEILGETVVLPCLLKGWDGYIVQWLQDGYALGQDLTLPEYPRYYMADNYSLIIENLTKTDEAKYVCQVAKCKQESKPIYLQYAIQPTVPQPDIPSGSLSLKENEHKPLICKAFLAHPSPNLTWYRDREELNATKTTKCEDDFGLCNVTSAITIIASSANDGARYECNLTSEALSDPKMVSYYVIEVNYPVDAAVIGGAVAGCVAFLILLILLIYFILKRRKNKKEKAKTVNVDVNEPEAYDNPIEIDLGNKASTEENIIPAKSIPNSGAKPESDDQSDSSKSEISSAESAYFGTSDEDSDIQSVKPPGGETFSISSSILVSDRGSPVVFNDFDIDDIPNADISIEGYNTQHLHYKQITDV